MSTISPRGRCKAPISCGSSCATEAECGHHAPSMSPPCTRARVIRTGRAQRRAPAEPFTIVALQTRQSRRWAGPKMSGIRPVFRGRRPTPHIPVRRDGKTGSSCPCGVLTNEEVDRLGAVDERTTIESHADLFRNAFTIRDHRENAVHPRLYRQWACTLAATHRRVEGVQDRRAAMLIATLAVAFDGRHVVKRFFILAAPALIWWLTR